MHSILSGELRDALSIVNTGDAISTKLGDA